MTSFLNTEEKRISRDFENKGYIIRNVADQKSLKVIQNFFVKEIHRNIKISKNLDNSTLLNSFHKMIKYNNLNVLRLKIINSMEKNKDLRKLYYLAAKPFIETIVGNELSMQLRINLSIQLPNDKSSLLSVHSDVWSGDSPFEVVAWIPLVDCYDTKTMYILPPKKNKKFILKKYKNSKTIFKSIYKDLIWPKVNFGQVLIFNQALPHGNVVNKENETRWSMNCRFKNVFTPYGDKKLGEFFEPITLRKASQLGINYKSHKLK